MNERLGFKKLHPMAILPNFAHPGDAGADLYATQYAMITSKGPVCVSTGLSVAIPSGWVGLIHPRSGMALRGVTVANTPGTIDSGYRGEIKVMLVRIGGPEIHYVYPGERIAQLVLQRYEYFDAEWVSELDDTERGEGGFGSTGMV